jgi:hypothetical protein
MQRASCACGIDLYIGARGKGQPTDTNLMLYVIEKINQSLLVFCGSQIGINLLHHIKVKKSVNIC